MRSAIPAGGVKDLLSGKPIGHALHPLLTDVVIGAWTSASILDLVGGEQARPAAERLIGVGILAALPTSLSRRHGLGRHHGEEPSRAPRRRRACGAQRRGAGASTAPRSPRGAAGAAGQGVLLGLAGAGVLGASGGLGGHLSYAAAWA